MTDDTVRVKIVVDTGSASPEIAQVAAAMQKLNVQALGASSSIEKYAAALSHGAAPATAAAQAIEKVAAAAAHGHGATATATNEFRALFDEISSGRTTRTPGTLAIIANRVFGLQGAALAATGGVAGLAFALFEVVRSGEQLNEAFGDIEAAMDATGRGADYSRGALAGIIETLRDIPGVSTKAAEDLVEVFARNREIGVGSYTALGQAAAGWARITGESVPKAGETLSKALSDGYKGIETLNDQFRFLTPAQQDAVRGFEEMGDRGRELDVVIGALQGKIAPLATVGLTPLQIAANDAAVGWDHLMHGLSQSGPIADATEALAGLLEALGRLVGYDPLSEQIGMAQDRVTALKAAIDGYSASATTFRTRFGKVIELSGSSSAAPEKLRSELAAAQAQLAQLQAQAAKPPPPPTSPKGAPNGDTSGDDSDAENRARRCEDGQADMTARLPTLAAGWSVHKKPLNSTRISTHVSGREVTAALWSYPLYEFNLTYEVLHSDARAELQTLMGFFLQMQGQSGRFLYADPSDHSAVNQVIGVGDGTTTVFTAVRNLGGWVEPVGNIDNLSTLYFNDTPESSGWSVSGNEITFASPPTLGVTISASFTYSFLCRFLADQFDFENFMFQLWALKTLKFRSVKP